MNALVLAVALIAQLGSQSAHSETRRTLTVSTPEGPRVIWVRTTEPISAKYLHDLPVSESDRRRILSNYRRIEKFDPSPEDQPTCKTESIIVSEGNRDEEESISEYSNAALVEIESTTQGFFVGTPATLMKVSINRLIRSGQSEISQLPLLFYRFAQVSVGGRMLCTRTTSQDEALIASKGKLALLLWNESNAKTTEGLDVLYPSTYSLGLQLDSRGTTFFPSLIRQEMELSALADLLHMSTSP